MNPMNMAAMNPAAGGPVGGAMGMMNNAATPNNHAEPNEGLKIQLNTYIYDYFLKHGFHDCARALLKEDRIVLNTAPNTKQSPGRQVNGIDDSMDTDGKEDYPSDLPRPKVPDSPPGSSFLFDWYCIFSEMFVAQRQKGKPGQLNVTRQYLAQTENLQRLRDSQQNGGIMRNPQMMANQMSQFNNMRNMRNGAMPNEMQKTMMRNNMTQHQMQQFAQQQKLMQQNMQREQGEMEMNGNRPGSPSSADNAGSPNKRPRLEGGQFNGQQMAPNGRGQGMPNQAANNSIQMMMKNGINPQGMTPAQFQSFQNQNPAVQQKSIQVYAQNLAQHHNRSAMNQGAMPNGMMNPGGMPNQGSPMLQPMNENFMMDPNYNPAVNAQIRPGMPQPAGGQGGNHALQDYQMQLMLLEQQNKKRLMMARQEQDSMTRADGQPGIPAQQGMQPPGMSPSGSRNGPSPNPSDQMKRTPQLGQTGLPGSPTPGGPGGSPAPMNFNGQMPQDFNSQMFAMGKMGEGMMPGQGIRPPGQMNPNMQAGRMPANWQGGPQGQPVMQQPGQGQPQNVGTPQQTREMPPPQAPAPNAGRGTQPSSPSTSNQAPPTPQQANKANPTKGKKGKANSEKRPQKKGSAANAAAANANESGEPPATPTPSTPITPVHPNSFNKNQANAAANAAANAGGPTSAPQPPANAGQQPPPGGPQQPPGGAGQPNPSDPNSMAAMSNAPFGDFNGVDPSFNLDFGPLDAPDVLENFDFDSFLNNPDDGAGGVGGFNFDAAGLGLDGTYSVEGGAEV